MKKPEEPKILRSVSVAKREGETWTLRLVCGHEVGADATRKRHASPRDTTDAAFEPPPVVRQRCPECERDRDSTPTLF